MSWLSNLFYSKAYSETSGYRPLSGNESDDDLRQRVKALTPDEAQVYKWVREAYSTRWIAETLMKSKSEVRVLVEQICRKLGADNARGVIRAYGVLDKVRPEPIEPGDPDDL